MAEYRVSRNARRDLAKIWAHIADDSSENADVFLQAIVKRNKGPQMNADKRRSVFICGNFLNSFFGWIIFMLRCAAPPHE